jgi:hypothetical protein
MTASDIIWWGFVGMATVSLVGGWFFHRAMTKHSKTVIDAAYVGIHERFSSGYVSLMVELDMRDPNITLQALFERELVGFVEDFVKAHGIGETKVKTRLLRGDDDPE